jgi:hypothetical protein
MFFLNTDVGVFILSFTTLKTFLLYFIYSTKILAFLLFVLTGEVSSALRRVYLISLFKNVFSALFFRKISHVLAIENIDLVSHLKNRLINLTDNKATVGPDSQLKSPASTSRAFFGSKNGQQFVHCSH